MICTKRIAISMGAFVMILGLKSGLNHLKRVACAAGLIVATLAGPLSAQEKSAKGAFSFDVNCDSRSMMYLPYKKDQEAEARKLMVDMFGLVFPAKVSEEMVEKYVKLIYDPSNNELIQIVMPFMTASQVTTLRVDKGWVTEASVEDIKLLPGVTRTMFRLEGGDWVAREIVKDVRSGQAKFVLSTGDLIWWAKQGNSPSDSPYWKLVNGRVGAIAAPGQGDERGGLGWARFPRSRQS